MGDYIPQLNGGDDAQTQEQMQGANIGWESTSGALTDGPVEHRNTTQEAALLPEVPVLTSVPLTGNLIWLLVDLPSSLPEGTANLRQATPASVANAPSPVYLSHRNSNSSSDTTTSDSDTILYGNLSDNRIPRFRLPYQVEHNPFEDEMSRRLPHPQINPPPSGRGSSAQPFHSQLTDLDTMTSGVNNMSLRRQLGALNGRDESPSPESASSHEHGAPLSSRTQDNQGAQRPLSQSFASRQIQRNQRNSGSMVSFQLPTNQNVSSRVPGQNAAQPGHSRGASHQGQSRRQSQGQDHNDQAPRAPNQPYTVALLSAQFQAKLAEVLLVVERIDNLPGPIREQLNDALRKMGQDFNASQRQLQNEWDRRAIEYNQLSRELEQVRQEISAVVQDRARISSERDALQLRVSELRLQHKHSSGKLTELEQEWKAKNDTLIEKLRIQDEQLKGKRALWLSSNPNSSARRDAMTALRDPFNSPTPDTGMGMTRKLGPLPGPSGYTSGNQPQPPRGSKARGLPTGKALSVHERDPVAFLTSRSSRPMTTEPGDTPINPMYAKSSQNLSKALVLRSESQYTDPCPPFQEALEELFNASEKWAKKFASKPNSANDRLIAQSNQVLWDYMMNCTYPGERQNAHTHATTLLNDTSTRHWFIMRMIVGYFVNDVLQLSAFQNYSAHTDRVFAYVKKSLEERGLANERRQVLIDQQSNAVRAMVAAPDFQDFRRTQLNRHTRSLRDMLGPLLNEGCERAVAGKEIGEVAVLAWELSVKMYASNLTFQIFFPETCTKFTAAIMNSRDHPKENPNTLQTRQIRVKLVITPIITLRDDRTTTIRVKNLAHSDVLLMA